jgi:hypothetical protein
MQAFSTCCTSVQVLDSLRIVSREFTEMHVLASRFFFFFWSCIFTWYAALRARDSHSNDHIFSCVSCEEGNCHSASQLLQSPNTADEFSLDTMNEIHALITQSANAYQEALSSNYFQQCTTTPNTSQHTTHLRPAETAPHLVLLLITLSCMRMFFFPTARQQQRTTTGANDVHRRLRL